jgi:hypothetical protein
MATRTPRLDEPPTAQPIKAAECVDSGTTNFFSYYPSLGCCEKLEPKSQSGAETDIEK